MEKYQKRSQHPWKPPDGNNKTGLKVYNSLTRQKEEFIPQKGKKVLWYSCGPTVYDSAHLGHARSYISFDILRRVFIEYFNYDVLYCMNITDIDDKIIKRSRQRFLLETYKSQCKNIEHVKSNVKLGLDNMNKRISNESCKNENDQDTSKLQMMKRISEKVEKALNLSNVDDLINESADILMDILDEKIIGSELIDDDVFKVLKVELKKELERDVSYKDLIFGKLSSAFENEFYDDMRALNVLDADVITRVSEYISEIIEYIEKIIQNGYAYESNGSVYFDTVKFATAPNHFYSKLVPEAFGNEKALHEGEGDLSISLDRLQEKRSPNDFALWKDSKLGEPIFKSPWGFGRPGWHIECSVMASSIIGDSMDIHTGGVDLRFPHHDNEMAQAEAYYENDNWVRYFLHSGHLHIDGCKMSKSLKNFISIKQALMANSSRQLRLLFLLHSWKDTLDYSEQTLSMVISFEKMFNEFFLNIKHVLRKLPSAGTYSFEKWKKDELELNESLTSGERKVHEALCDSIDTKTTMFALKDLITDTNIYLANNRANPNKQLLQNIAKFVTKMLGIFGVVDHSVSLGFGSASSETIDVEEKVMPYLEAFAKFREDVRSVAKNLKISEILQSCDLVRDEVLPNIGVKFEDLDGLPTVIKLVNKEILKKEFEENKKLEEEKKRLKEKKAEEIKAIAEEKERQNKIPPMEMFKDDAKYSKFDEIGMPTHDSKGELLSKSQLKKLQKLYDIQKKKFEKWITESVN